MVVQSDPVKSKPNDEIEFPSTREAFFIWLKIGLLSFGGPAGQIAMMHRVLVEEKRWISEERVLHALNYVMLLQDPRRSNWPRMLDGSYTERGEALLRVDCLSSRVRW